MELVIASDGAVRCLYDEAIDLRQLGVLSIRRASYVEATDHGQWVADLSPCRGPILGPFPCRSAALEAEGYWLEVHWLGQAR
jgi:hypothetical protein